MGSTSFTRRAVLQPDGTFELKYRTSTGELRTQIIEDKSAGGVSTRALELKKENISSTIELGKIAYSITDNFNANSLCVYLNGMNVSVNITETGTNTFTFSSDYINGIASTDELLVVYVKA